MTLDQIKKFIQQAKEAKEINKIKVVGGEPLVHPDFVNIYNVLAKAADERVFNYLKIDTNKTVKVPKVDPCSYVKWSGKHPSKKRHMPTLWSPKDLGFQTKGPCAQISKCGYSLDKYGYLPCSLAIMIVRLFGLNHLYKYEYPKGVWGLEELCPHCIFSMPHEWRVKWWTPLSKITEEEKTPTKTYAEALKKWDVEKFYQTQREF
jgi:hypothetical protein